MVRLDDVSEFEQGRCLSLPASGETELCERDDQRELEGAIDQLPERERHIVREHYFKGVRFKDLSAELGVSEPRISQLHTRAMQRLRDHDGQRLIRVRPRGRPPWCGRLARRTNSRAGPFPLLPAPRTRRLGSYRASPRIAHRPSSHARRGGAGLFSDSRPVVLEKGAHRPVTLMLSTAHDRSCWVRHE